MSTPTFENLVDVYRRSVDIFAERPVFGTKDAGEWHWMTYREFGDQVDRARGGLHRLGIGKGDRVAIISNNRPPWAVAAYASYGLGAVFVPMYEAQVPKEWAYILGDSESRIVFVPDDEIAGQVAGMQGDLPYLDNIVVIDGEGGDHALTFPALLGLGNGEAPEPLGLDEKDLAGFIYTSGTTGNPKGVLLTHGNIVSNVRAMHDVFPLSPDDRSLSFLPWAHSFGQTVELHAGISMGCSMGIARSPQTVVEDLPEVQPTLLVSVPRVFNLIHDGLHKRIAAEGGIRKRIFEAAVANSLRRKELAERGQTSGTVEMKHRLFDRIVFAKVRDRFGGRLQYAFSGGAALAKEVADFIDAFGILVYEGYGLSETSPVVTANWPGTRKIGSVGKPIPGVRVEIDHSVTDEWGDGEVVVYGPNVMQGYHNLPDETADVFTNDGGFRTGDLGRLDDDGFLHITGRIKEQYKLSNGKYVVPTPIEEQLKLSPFVTSALVYGDNRPHNVALIVPDLEALEMWAAEQGLPVGDHDGLLARPEVRKLIGVEIGKHSEAVKPYETVRDFMLLGDDFTPENGLLTPTLKVKRRAVVAEYGDDLLALYDT